MKKTLVFGASLNPNRYSHYAIQRLVANKHEVVAFGLREGEVEGVMIDTELKPYEDIDTVTLYMNAKRQKEYYNYLISLKPERIIFNPGTENPEFFKLLEENNINFEMSCTLVLLSTNQY
ncbi:CoA-binding protein [Flavobacteriaceae bacterium S0825]|uniref:CoA-binding protein n=1 Tax=Gaetbulibacter sp. S0825 TaxID=2720084 RepID=UPI0014312BD7|nr:CoA-binding protein [Gaetbulibacter sp. S0825]MCK0110174.1 CoA-binding protein [Flavobacteriaceae bacterium S0825]NIX65803.1 CoA-binding protein [Gaetbulibacter sp. S0825]